MRDLGLGEPTNPAPPARHTWSCAGTARTTGSLGVAEAALAFDDGADVAGIDDLGARVIVEGRIARIDLHRQQGRRDKALRIGVLADGPLDRAFLDAGQNRRDQIELAVNCYLGFANAAGAYSGSPTATITQRAAFWAI